MFYKILIYCGYKINYCSLRYHTKQLHFIVSQ